MMRERTSDVHYPDDEIGRCFFTLQGVALIQKKTIAQNLFFFYLQWNEKSRNLDFIKEKYGTNKRIYALPDVDEFYVKLW